MHKSTIRPGWVPMTSTVGCRLAGFVIAVLLGMSPGMLRAQASIELQGQIIGRNRAPRAYSRVQLNRQGGRYQYIVVTGPDGRFTISRLLTGRYAIRVRQGDNTQQFIRQIEAGELVLQVRW